MKKNKLEKKAVIAAIHMNEFFDQEELYYFVEWSKKMRYHPYEAMLFLARQVKKDHKEYAFDGEIIPYINRTTLYFFAKRMQQREIRGKD